MENKPSVDPGILAPALLGILSIVGMVAIFIIGRVNGMRPTDETTSTATPFRYIYLGTEPGLSTLTPEPTETPISIAPPEEDAGQPFSTKPSFILTSTTDSFVTPGSTSPAFPTQPSVRTSTPSATETIPAVLSKFDDTYYEILYDGDWTSQTNVTGAYQNTLHISFEVENYAYFVFVGEQIILTFQAGPSLGEILIDLDGFEFQVSQSNSQTQLVEWRSPVLVPGTHEIVVEHLSGGSVNIDSFTIPDLSRASPTSTPTLTPTP
jgi:hypothetical protein